MNGFEGLSLFVCKTRRPSLAERKKTSHERLHRSILQPIKLLYGACDPYMVQWFSKKLNDFHGFSWIFNGFQYPGLHIWLVILQWVSIILNDFQWFSAPWTLTLWPLVFNDSQLFSMIFNAPGPIYGPYIWPYMIEAKGHGSPIT